MALTTPARGPEGADGSREAKISLSAVNDWTKGALAGLMISSMASGALAQERSSFTGQEVQVADSGAVLTDATTAVNSESLNLPAEYVFRNNAGEELLISSDKDMLFVAFSFQQVLSMFSGDVVASLSSDWLNLSVQEMQQVLDIHAGKIPLEGESNAHQFYQKMLVSFLDLGRDGYMLNAPINDPEGWEGYAPEEISDDWDDFIEKYSVGNVNTDIDYRVISYPQFFDGISIFFPHNPMTEAILQEISILEGQEQIAAIQAEGQEQIAAIQAEGQEQIAEYERRIMEYDRVIQAADRLSNTLARATNQMDG